MPYELLDDAPPTKSGGYVLLDDPAPVKQKTIGENVKQGAADVFGGLIRGAGSIGATIVAPGDIINDALHGKGFSLESNRQRRADMDAGLQSLLGSNPDALLYKGGKLAGEVAGTAGAGSVLANGARALGASAPIVEGLASGGLNVAGRTGLAGLATRAATGAVTGAVAAGAVNPEDAGAGAVIGGAFPVGVKALGKVGSAIGSTLSGGRVSPEVVALAERAKQLGIDVPADRLNDSKFMNALSATLNYVPFSGRAATEAKMQSQLNRALSRTFGQDSDNVTKALRQASTDLGSQFDSVLKNNTVKVDNTFLNDLVGVTQKAGNELEAGQAKIIGNQVDEILAKAQNGVIDGQAAYNIKRTLDNIAKRNTPEGFYAKELRGKLMDALNRSLTPQEAAGFATTRQQYGNMKSLEKLAQNGAEGDISIGRLANLKNIGNKDLQELADISAQFLKTRESPHGAMQRLVIGGLGAGIGGVSGLPYLAGASVAGRGANAALNSEWLRSLMINGVPQMPAGLLGVSKVAPLLATD